MKARTKLLLGAAIAALALAGPGSAIAAEDSDDATVAGLGTSELALVVATPAVMPLLYTTPGTSASLVTVASTSLSWTLSIRDADTILSGTPGRMNRVECVGVPPRDLFDPATSLTNPLEWSVDLGENYTDLTGTNATVKEGSLADALTVTYRQALDAETDAVALDQCYELTATYTLTDS